MNYFAAGVEMHAQPRSQSVFPPVDEGKPNAATQLLFRSAGRRWAAVGGASELGERTRQQEAGEENADPAGDEITEVTGPEECGADADAESEDECGLGVVQAVAEEHAKEAQSERHEGEQEVDRTGVL